MWVFILCALYEAYGNPRTRPKREPGKFGLLWFSDEKCEKDYRKMDLSKQILSILTRIQREKKEIKLTNYYKGVPVVYPAALLSVNQAGWIQVKVHKYQIICLNRDTETIIQNDFFEGYIQAKASNVDVGSASAVLSHFEYVKDKFLKRETFRVAPKEPTPIWLTIKEIGFKVKCQLVDVSAEGMAVHLPEDFYTPRRIKKSAEVLLEFQLPIIGISSPANVQARGIIKNTIGSAGYQQKRIGIRVYYDRRGGELVSQYAQQRMIELRREMDRTYDALLRLSRS